MHGSISKLTPIDDSGYRAIAQYHTSNTTARLYEGDARTLLEMTGYYYEGVPGPRWFGGAAAVLGLVEGSLCTERQLYRALKHLDPRDGSTLPTRGGFDPAVSAMDFTFSVEKDVSILWLLGDEATKRGLESIMDLATSEAMKFMEEQSAVIRLGAGGLAHRSSSGFLAIQNDHTTARPVNGSAAPHLHRHYVIMNIAEFDGRWSALDATRLFNLQKVTAAIAGQKVRELTSQRFGVSWTREEKGTFSIDGLDPALRSRLSIRQEQILATALERGLDITRRGEWVKAQRISREGKHACGSGVDDTEWAVTMLLEEGITYETVTGALHEAKTTRDRAVTDRAWLTEHFGVDPDDRYTAAQALTAHNASLLHGRAATTPDWARFEVAMGVSTKSKEEQIQEVLLEVGRAKSTWRRRDLLIALADFGIELHDATAYADTFMSGPDCVYICGVEDGQDNAMRVRWVDQEVYATTETLEKERLLIAAAKRGLGARGAVLDEEEFNAVLREMEARGKTLSSESDQFAMLELLLRGGDAISLVSGQAGSGKSAGIEALSIAVANGWLASSKTTADAKHQYGVVGCTLTANAAKNLADKAGIEAESVAYLTTHLQRGDVALLEGAIVVVDECSQVSTAQLAALWQFIEAVRGRLFLLGDERQLQAVEAGGLYSTLITKVPEATAFLDETRRQRDLEERAVLAVVHDRGVLSDRAARALERQGLSTSFMEGLRQNKLSGVYDWYKEHDRFVLHASPDAAAAAIATTYWDAVGSENPQYRVAVVTATSNPEIRVLDAAIVAEGTARGVLDSSALVEFGRREFLLGQRVVARKINRGLDILNGQIGAVRGVETVVTKWEVGIKTPSPYARKRIVSQEVEVGETTMVSFSASQVTNERRHAAAHLAKMQTQLSQVQARTDSVLQTPSARVAQKKARHAVALTKREAAMAQAETWLAWANSLAAGGQVIPSEVVSSKVKAEEDCLVVELDQGGTRYLTESFVTHHLDSGYVLTAQRGQGGDADIALTYNTYSYVPMSRGKDTNIAHIVLPENNSGPFDELRTNQATTRNWLSHRVGPDAFLSQMDTARRALRSGAVNVMVPVGGNLEATIASTTRAGEIAAARQVVEARGTGIPALLLAKTQEQVRRLNHVAVTAALGLLENDAVPVAIDDRVWVRGMPVLVVHGEVPDLERDTLYTVTAVSKHGMTVKGDGALVRLSPEQIHSHIDQGYAITVARAQQTTSTPGRYVVIADGLADFDLKWLEATVVPTSVVVVDEEVAAQHDYDQHIRGHILPIIERDCGIGSQSKSATHLIDLSSAELGLASLQAEIRLSASAIKNARRHSPRDLARRDIETQLGASHQRADELRELVDRGETEVDRTDAQTRLAEVEVDLHELQDRYNTINSQAPDTDPGVAHELILSALYHASDVTRFDEATERLKRYTQGRVTAAMKDPRPYHDAIVVDETLTTKAARERRQEALVLIEEFRAKWNITDSELPLGELPEEGVILDEWIVAHAVLDAMVGEHLVRGSVIQYV